MFNRFYQGFGGYGMHGYGMGFMGIFWILLLILFVLVIWKLFSNSQKTNPTSNEDTALELLKKEFAKGNITEEEFERKKRLLK